MDVRRWLRLLRPTKFRMAVRRRWFERGIRRLAVTPGTPVVHLGSGYGGWFVPVGVVDATWTCYSVGAGVDVTFDLELIARFGATVRSFDPLEAFGHQALDEAGGDPRFTFHHAAIAPDDGTLSMYVDGREGSGSLSAANLHRTSRTVTVPARSLPSVMAELGDERIDLLKLDIEGSEYELLRRLDLAALGVRVLLVELHHTAHVRDARRLVARLNEAGYDLVHREPATDLTFVSRQIGSAVAAAPEPAR